MFDYRYYIWLGSIIAMIQTHFNSIRAYEGTSIKIGSGIVCRHKAIDRGSLLTGNLSGIFWRDGALLEHREQGTKRNAREQKKRTSGA